MRTFRAFATTRHLPLVAALSLLLILSAACGTDEGEDNGGGAKADTSVGGDTSGGEVTETDTSTADAGGQDTGASADADAGGDAGTPEDSGSADTGSTKGCPGGDGCDCSENGECNSGICLDTHEGKKCATKCTETCDAPGYDCKNIGDGEPLFYCVSTRLTLCAPCQFHSECQVNGVGSLCVDYGEEGKFCGSPCEADSDCPGDYSCSDVSDGGGNTVKQCKRKSDAGVCECSDWAKAKGAETECAVTNDNGTCKAKRSCGSDGLSACEASTPAAEVCNTMDDDCDGETDNLAKDFACTKKTFADSGSKSACSSDSECSTEGEACDDDGKCKTLIGACPGKAACSATGELICTGAATAKVEVCNGEDDDCDGAKDEDFTYTGADGSKLTVGSACGTGPCAGGTVICDGDKATCNSLDKAANEDCDGVDDDCDGKTDNLACDDSNACTTDSCDASSGKCTNEVTVDCDDQDVCTEDKCDPQTAKCNNTPSDASCDDGNACTVGDKCGTNPETSKHECLPGTDAPKCDDSNPCTDDICDTQKGCQSIANSGTQPCYSGDKATQGVGECKAGTSFCKDGKLQGECKDEVLPKQSELCDGKDHTCNGKTDEGCTPKNVAVTFTSARVQGKAGQLDVDMLVGQSGQVGDSKSDKHGLKLGFLAWLNALLK